MNIIFEFDDLHWKNPENCINTIDKLIYHHQDIKLSFFTIAKLSGIPLYANSNWCNTIRKYIDKNNIRLAIHGLDHSPEEFKITDKLLIKNKLMLAEDIFNKAKLPYTKVFKGPHWGITQEVYDVLNDLDYKLVYSHPDKPNFKSNIKTVFYNWNLKDKFHTFESTLIAHGHTHNVCENGIAEVYSTISDFILYNNPIFKFVDEV